MAVGEQQTGEGRTWTFLTNHAHVLLVVRRDPDVLLRDIADRVGITTRAAQLILGDLEQAGYLRRTRNGRRNRYTVLGGPLRHPLERGRAVDDLLSALGTPEPGPSEASASGARARATEATGSAPDVEAPRTAPGRRVTAPARSSP